MDNKNCDVIIIGGSYAGLAAAMALGRALRQVLIIDDGEPCNQQTPHSHNFLTQDGKTPKEIATLAKRQVEAYGTVMFFNGRATVGAKTKNGFNIEVMSGETFHAGKLIFATGISDMQPGIEGFSACWGISVLHCPYCHGYEVRDQKTGILGNGDYGFEFSVLISNWTKDLTLFTNGKPTLTSEQTAMLERHDISIIEAPIQKLEHNRGYLKSILFKDDTTMPISAIYTRTDFQQNCNLPTTFGCELDEEGYIVVDHLQKTNVPGIFACGDSTNRMRTVANAVATGTTAGMILNKEFVFENFK
ncbi:MAG: NAD(P)/FAD-dependent oxidoreductase [Ferruginibacter sp.]|nr:NAD(P)/FAD-dependent oxidoreductase [Ferruginibacter sp.]